MLDRCNVQTGIGLWMRPAYREGFLLITTVVRRRDRSDPNTVGYIPLGQDIPVRFIEQMGRRDENIQPKLYPDDGTTVRLSRRVVKPIQELTDVDLEGGALDIDTPDLVRYHLALIDNTALPDWTEVVTIYHFEHRPPAVDPDA